MTEKALFPPLSNCPGCDLQCSVEYNWQEQTCLIPDLKGESFLSFTINSDVSCFSLMSFIRLRKFITGFQSVVFVVVLITKGC